MKNLGGFQLSIFSFEHTVIPVDVKPQKRSHANLTQLHKNKQKAPFHGAFQPMRKKGLEPSRRCHH